MISTIGEQLRTNPYLRADELNEFLNQRTR